MTRDALALLLVDLAARVSSGVTDTAAVQFEALDRPRPEPLLVVRADCQGDDRQGAPPRRAD
jgi:hypothetical protein